MAIHHSRESQATFGILRFETRFESSIPNTTPLGKLLPHHSVMMDCLTGKNCSKPGPMTQTNRQKHSAAMVVCIWGVGESRRTFARAKVLDFDQIWAVSDTVKA